MSRFTAILLLVWFAMAAKPQAQVATLPATFELKNVDGHSIPYQNGMVVPGFEKQNRTLLSLHGAWRKQRFNADHALTLSRRTIPVMNNLTVEAAGRERSNYDDSAWPEKILPAIENELRGYEKTPEYYENGVWYRRPFKVPDSLAGQTVKLHFYAVNYVADVWINGQYVGYHEGGYTAFAFDVSAMLDYGNTNTIAVRVDNPPWGTRKDIVPFYKVDWFNYTGIIHDVFLEACAPQHIVRTQIVPLTIEGDLSVQTVIANQAAAAQNLRVTLDIFAAEVTAENIASEFAQDVAGPAVTCSGTSETTLSVDPDSIKIWQTQLRIAAPQLWYPKTPNLYVLCVSLWQDGVLLDQYYSQFGIRTIVTQGAQVLLNGKPVFFTGVARHEDHPDYGRSIPAEVILADIQKIKALNTQFLRSGHYPNHPATFLYCDRVGLAAMEEIPVWWFDNEEEWLIQNNQRHIHEQMWREMIFRDYNRPSLILWSTCNECKEVPNRRAFIQRVHDELDQKYPDGRLVSQSAAADRPGPADESQHACDVAGWTMYFGIFHGGTYYKGTVNFLNKVRDAFPDKPVINTEFGYWSSENGSNENTQVLTFKDTFQALTESGVLKQLGKPNPGGFLMATTWWCAFDWYTCQQTNGYQSMGILHMDRTTKKKVHQNLTISYIPYNYYGGTTEIDSPRNESSLPQTWTLLGNFPNPFNHRTVIAYELARPERITLEVLNLRGEVVATLDKGQRNAGIHQAVWDGAGGGSGIYFARLLTAQGTHIHKMTLLR